MTTLQDLGQYQNKLNWTNKLARLGWGVAYTLLMRPAPRIFPAWHRLVLRLFGASVGPNVCIDPTARIWAPWNLRLGAHAWIGPRTDIYCVDVIDIAEDVVVSQDACLCTASHDIRDPAFPLITAPIRIEAGAWVAARAFVGPGVTIAAGAVVAACAVVVKDVAAEAIVGGNPAKLIGQRIVAPEPPRGPA